MNPDLFIRITDDTLFVNTMHAWPQLRSELKDMHLIKDELTDGTERSINE